MIPPQDRYEVRQVQDRERWVIYDLAFRRACKLAGRLLVWATQKEARGWLEHCYTTWGADPALGQEPPPKAMWGKRRWTAGQDRSPWEGYTTPASASETPLTP